MVNFGLISQLRTTVRSDVSSCCCHIAVGIETKRPASIVSVLSGGGVVCEKDVVRCVHVWSGEGVWCVKGCEV